MTIKQLFNKIERANEIGSMFGDKYGIEMKKKFFFGGGCIEMKEVFFYFGPYFTYNDFTKALKEKWHKWFVKGVLNKENEVEHGIGHSEKEFFMRFTYQVPWETNESIQTIYFTIVKI